MHDDISLPGVSTADLGGPEMAGLGQDAQDLRREKSRALGPSYGKRDGTLGPEMSNMRRTSALDVTAETGFRPAGLPPGRDIKSLDPEVKSSSLGPMTPLDEQSKSLAVSQAQGGDSHEPLLSERRGATNHGATLAAGGVRQQLPLDKDNIRSLGSASSQAHRARDSFTQRNQRARNCGPTRDLSDLLEIYRHERLGSEPQRGQSLAPQPHVGKDHEQLGRATPQAHGERTYRLPPSQTQDVRSSTFSLPRGTRNSLSAAAGRQHAKDLRLEAKDTNVPRVRGTAAVENRSRGYLNLQAQGGRRYGPVIPGAGGIQSLGVASVEGQESTGFTAEGQEAKHLSNAEHEATKSKTLSIPGQTGRNPQGTSKSKDLSLHKITMSPSSLRSTLYFYSYCQLNTPSFHLLLCSPTSV